MNYYIYIYYTYIYIFVVGTREKCAIIESFMII